MLTGEVNGIDMTATGNARPFGDKITVNAEVSFDNVEIAKIETYTGPLDLTSRQGVLTVYARNDVSIFPDGRIEGGSEGSLALNGIDLAKDQAGSVKLDQGVVGFDVDYTTDKSGTVVTGKTDGRFERMQGALPDGTALASSEIKLDLPDLRVGMPADKSVTLATRPQLTMSEMAVSGPADFRAQQVLVQVPALAMSLKPGELTSVRLDSSADGAVRPGIEVQAAALAAPVAARADALRLTTPNLSFEARPEQGSAVRVDAANGAGGARLEVQKPALDGSTEVRMAAVSLDLAPLALDIGAGGKMALRTNAVLSAGEGDVKVAGQGASPLSVAFATMGLKVASLDVAKDGETTKVGGGLDANAGQLSLVLPQPEQGAGGSAAGTAGAPPRLAAESWTLALPSLAAATSGRGTTLQAKGTSTIDALSAAVPMGGPSPGDVSVRTTRLTLSAFDLAADRDGSLRLDANLAADLQALAAAWATGAAAPPPPPPPQRARRGRSGPAPVLPATAAVGETAGRSQIGADRFALALNKLGVRKSSEGDTNLAIAGTSDVGNLTAKLPGTAAQGAVDVSLAALRLGFGDLAVALSKNAETGVKGRLDIGLDKLAGSQASIEAIQRDPLRFAVDRTRLGLADIDVRSGGDRLQAGGTATADIAGVSADLPEQGVKRPRVQMTLRTLRASVDQARYETTNRGPRWSVEVDTLADAISAQAAGGKLLTAKMKSVSLQGGRFDQARAVGIDRLAIERPEVFVSREYVEHALGPRRNFAPRRPHGRSNRRPAPSASAASRSTTAAPSASATTSFSRTSTSKSRSSRCSSRTSTRRRRKSSTTLLVDATVNQFTQVNMAGWIASPGAKPDFDLNGRVRRLELPPLSPYAAQAIGVNVEGGQLGITANATAKKGVLAGDIDIILRNLGFSALSAKEAEKLSASLGVPIETIVGLLQNDEGVIRLSLPLSGDMAAPSFDLSDAIGQAVSGAVKAAALAPFKLAFLPVSMLANAAGGGALDFAPIPFEPGSNAVSASGETIVESLAKVLKERRKLRLLVCGKATSADASEVLTREGERATGAGRDAAIERLAPQLWSLAGERTAAIRRALVDAGAEPKQVAECRTTFDAADTKPPRVEVTL